MIKLLDLLKEAIRAEEAYSAVPSIETIVDGKRDVAFVTKGGTSSKDWMTIMKLVKDNNLVALSVEGNPNKAFIIYKPGSEARAKELKDIAEKYGGYLSYEATEEESRRIGELLSYDERDIEDYIQKNYKKSDNG